MHSPETLAFEIKNPFVKKSGGYRPALLSIWHKDPEKDGTDDSCGWFKRIRHCDKEKFEQIITEFTSEWDGTYTSEDSKAVYFSGWFTPGGRPRLSVPGIVSNMFLYAAKIALVNKKDSPTKAWKKAFAFMKKHHVRITYFAENTRDSICDTIMRKFEIGTNTPYTPEARLSMIRSCAETIYTYIERISTPWYKHPRWHIHHWSIQFHPIQNLKRRYWDKCCVCGKRGFKGAAMSDWNGTKLWHQHCDQSQKPA